ncbi:MAG: hypothetical protein VR72_02710 [Clostridiaceae bacterium BRH_c20a]|nr:MAG: hypothetical protein VR72_02710 [Clostridiaceae bacterium BRH_c20a]
MKDIEQSLGVYKVTIDLPLWVNNIQCFLFKGEDGWDIVDTGIYTPGAMEKWKESFRKLRINPLDVRQIIITHDHVDHFGAAGELQKLTQAPVKMVNKENSLVKWKDWLKEILHEDSVFHFFGLPKELKEEVIREKGTQFKNWVPSIPETEDIRAQETIVLGCEQYQILTFPGHCAEQICFYHPDREVLFAGDVLVTPNHLNATNQEPLTDYFKILELLQKMKIAYLFPSHGKPFARVDIRIGLIAEYRKQQMSELKEHLSKESTVYQAYLFFLSRGALTDLFFGLTEVYYFLEHLVKLGELKKVTREDCFYYKEVNKNEMD